VISNCLTWHIVSCLDYNANYSSTDDLLTRQTEFACFTTALHHKFTCIANLQILSKERFKEKESLILSHSNHHLKYAERQLVALYCGCQHLYIQDFIFHCVSVFIRSSSYLVKIHPWPLPDATSHKSAILHLKDKRSSEKQDFPVIADFSHVTFSHHSLFT